MPNIPDRWIPYKACGNVIEGTRFICFKVPLRKNVQTGNKDIKEIWDIPALLDKIPKLGAVIDLTNTAKYYNPAELRASGLLHKKILMPGRVIPPEDKVTEFMNAVDEFLGKDCVAVQVKRARLGLSASDFLVGIHCTHGLNRTGYMVCRYMRDRLGFHAKDAIKKFEKARGYQIERENYIADLLGKEPPPPDVGQDTVVKPLESKKKPYKRSVVNVEEDEDEEEGSRYNSNRIRRQSRYDRFIRNRGGGGHSSSNRNGEQSKKNCKSIDADSDTNWRLRDRSGNEKNKQYSYKYDY